MTFGAVAIVGVALVVAGLLLVGATERALEREVRDVALLRAQDVASLLQSDGTVDVLAVNDAEDLIIQVLDERGRVVAASANVRGQPAMVVARVGAGESTTIDVPIDDDRFLAVTVATATPSGARTVVVARTLEAADESVQVLARLLWTALPVVLLAVGVSSWLVVGATLGRLHAAQARERRFFANASHELRSPIASIRQHAEVASAHPETTDTSTLAGTVLAETARLQGLVDDLFALARADEGAADVEMRIVDLDDIVLDESRRAQGVHPVTIDCSKVSAGRVHGDARSLRSVVRNLVDNAARHAVRTVTLSLVQQRDTVMLVVEDDGGGIPEGARTRVFDRFVRLDDARDRDSGGAGLGLAIVREVVTTHGGSVSIADSLLGGARVAVSLPGVEG